MASFSISGLSFTVDNDTHPSAGRAPCCVSCPRWIICTARHRSMARFYDLQGW